MFIIKIAGFQNNSFIDYPGKIASVVFLGGCNMRCVYCHNSSILCNSSNTMDFAEVLPKIKDQIGFTDGVVITGGEPTVHPNLMDMIKQIKELGLLVKLDTNGTNPKLLKELVSEKLVDYVAMDVKGSFEKYNEICGVNIDTKKIQESIEFLIGQNDIDYMFRTTLYPILDESDFQGMAELLKGTKTFQLQQFIPNDFSNSQKVVHLPYRPDQAEKFIQIIKPHVGEVLLRGF